MSVYIDYSDNISNDLEFHYAILLLIYVVYCSMLTHCILCDASLFRIFCSKLSEAAIKEQKN